MEKENKNNEKEPRQGLDESFKEITENGDDELLTPDVFIDGDLDMGEGNCF